MKVFFGLLQNLIILSIDVFKSWEATYSADTFFFFKVKCYIFGQTRN